MRRFDRLESEFNEITSGENEGFLALRIPRRRFNFRILAESVRGIEISSVVEENIKYKRAICESMMIANGENLSVNGESKLDALKQFGSGLVNTFISTLQLFWKHVKEFILAFFDAGVKATRVGEKLNKFLSRIDKKDPRYKGFLRTDFNKEIRDLPDIDPIQYPKVIHTLTEVSGDIITSFTYLHKTIEKNFVDKIKDKFKNKDDIKIFEYQKSDTKLGDYKKRISDLKKNTNFNEDKDSNINMSGEKIISYAEYLNKAFEDMRITPKGQTTNLLSNFKKIKELSSKKNLDDLIADVQNKFRASNNEFSEQQSILNQLSDIIRRSNSVLVEVHGIGKIYLGQMIKDTGVILKMLNNNVPLKKTKLNAADVNVKVDLSDVFGVKKGIKNIKESVKK